VLAAWKRVVCGFRRESLSLTGEFAEIGGGPQVRAASTISAVEEVGG
jgi:hypothetical protein